jgi:hypothetical protein
MKRHLPLAAVLVLALASLSFAQEATPSPSPKPKPRTPPVTQAQLLKQLSEMENALWNAWKNKDAKPFETHLSTDSVMVGEQGVSGKATIAKDITSMPCEVRSFTLSDWKLTKYGANHALITYKGVADGTCMGTAIPTTWASTLWVKRKGTWQAAFHQETPMKP